MRTKARNREAERLGVRAREKGSLFTCACVCVRDSWDEKKLDETL